MRKNVRKPKIEGHHLGEMMILAYELNRIACALDGLSGRVGQARAKLERLLAELRGDHTKVKNYDIPR